MCLFEGTPFGDFKGSQQSKGWVTVYKKTAYLGPVGPFPCDFPATKSFEQEKPGERGSFCGFPPEPAKRRERRSASARWSVAAS